MSIITRRNFVVGMNAVLGGSLMSFDAMAQQSIKGEKISAVIAAEKSAQDEILLVDIRRPDEWANGVAAGAHLISMHEDGFLEKLAALTEDDSTRPIALICATGGRTGFLAPRLSAYGYTQVYDVSEGMHGSAEGAGWFARGLPLADAE